MSYIKNGGISVKKFHFFSIVSRMKYINRWGLMRNSKDENLSEHSLEVAMIAHALCLIKNKKFEGQIDEKKAALIALYHDASEILTGDLPTTVKYHDEKIYESYKKVEYFALKKILNMLPEYLYEEYKNILLCADKDLMSIVKAADKISALIKCIEEENIGNNEFKQAKKKLLLDLKSLEMPEVEVFLSDFLPSYELSLDEQEIWE